MDQITETGHPLELTKISAESIYRGSQNFIKKVIETTSKLSPGQIKRGAIIAGLAIESFIITDLTPYKGNPVLEAFRKDSASTQVQTYDQPSTPGLQTEVPPEPPQSSSILESRLFKNFSEEERGVTEAEAEEQMQFYKKSDQNNKRAERVLNWETTTLEPILKLDVSEEDRSFWRNFISAVVYIESEGKQDAKSSIGALGLTQMTEQTAREIAAKHGILSFDLKKGWDNLRLGLLHFIDLFERYGADISLLGYYAGQNFTDQKVLSAIQGHKLNQNDLISLHSYIDHYRINIANLGSRDGKEYLRKFLAAEKILDQLRRG